MRQNVPQFPIAYERSIIDAIFPSVPLESAARCDPLEAALALVLLLPLSSPSIHALSLSSPFPRKPQIMDSLSSPKTYFTGAPSLSSPRPFQMIVWPPSVPLDCEKQFASLSSPEKYQVGSSLSSPYQILQSLSSPKLTIYPSVPLVYRQC
jgi:hypothetical protein